MGKADFERAKRQFPSYAMGFEAWVAFFDTPVGQQAMGRIIGDIYSEVRAQEDREAGIRRMGRRPKPEGNLADVFAKVFPEAHTMDPFPVALTKLVGSRSQRAFARRVPCGQATLSRWLSGRVAPDMYAMERVAAAAGVDPTFFVEYRAQYVGQLVTEVLTQRPNLGIRALQHVASGSPGAGSRTRGRPLATATAR